MLSVKPKLKRRGGGDCRTGPSNEAGGDRAQDLSSVERGKVNEGDHMNSHEGQQDDTQLRNLVQLEEFKLAKRKLELELRELELEKRERMLKLSEEQNKITPRKLFSRQIKEINQNIVLNKPDGDVKKEDKQIQSGEIPDLEEESEQKRESSGKEDVRIRELHDVVRKQQEMLNKFQEERKEEKLSMRLVSLLLEEKSKQQPLKEKEKSGSWSQGTNIWKRSMNSGFERGREAIMKKGVPRQNERNGFYRSYTQADQERPRVNTGGKESRWQKPVSCSKPLVKQIRHDIPVSVTGGRVTKKHLHPLGMFRDAGLSLCLLKNIDWCCYMEPTLVQQYAIPIILEGRDVMACAQTGAGKTAAYLIPVIQMLMKTDTVYRSGQHQPASPAALVLVPTRELVIQVFDEAKRLSHGSMVKPGVLYGGTNPHFQARDLAEGCNILVATLGRLLDFVARGIVTLRKVNVLVLDEADRLLDMSSLPHIEKCVDAMPEKGNRQTILFSRSFRDDIQTAAQKFLHDYAFLTVEFVDASSKGVVQKFFKTDKFEKREKLMEILLDPARDPRERMLIFVQTKRAADFLATYLSEEGFPATCIHGGMKQEDRETALDGFRAGVKFIMVATATGGLSGLNVGHVINYDMGLDLDDYMSRIGNIDIDHGRVSSFIDMAEDSELDFEQLSKLMTVNEAKALKLIGLGDRGGAAADEWG